MSVSTSAGEISGYYKLIKSATLFYSVPRDVETELTRGQNEIHAMSEIGQYFMSDWHDRNNTILSASSKEYEAIEC